MDTCTYISYKFHSRQDRSQIVDNRVEIEMKLD